MLIAIMDSVMRSNKQVFVSAFFFIILSFFIISNDHNEFQITKYFSIGLIVGKDEKEGGDISRPLRI